MKRRIKVGVEPVKHWFREVGQIHTVYTLKEPFKGDGMPTIREVSIYGVIPGNTADENKTISVGEPVTQRVRVKRWLSGSRWVYKLGAQEELRLQKTGVIREIKQRAKEKPSKSTPEVEMTSGSKESK